ncbi:MAG: peptidoglycan DD-metalloendopeptidase family protein [Alphaproteobacteria bacterium]|nr:peptidoglycan DD-metalloendopeptidase family protein [Alphaproteobacteria bacterium]
MKQRVFDWGLGVAAAALLGTGLTYVAVNSHVSEAATSTATATDKPDPRRMLAAITSADQLETLQREMRQVSIQRNETLSGVLDRVGAPRDQANGAVYAAGELVDLRKVRPGDSVTAWFETDPVSGQQNLTGLSLRPDVERQVLVSRGADGQWVTHELKAKLTSSYSLVTGTVDQSIYDSAVAQGAADQQVVDYATIFGYDIDFQREIQTGDKFEMFYGASKDERGDVIKGGDILYASLDGQALKKAFYRFTPSDDGVTDYFDATGQSARKFLMKTPINGARISSSFGNRVHPILGYTKLHKGTDFAAPTGTPIYAAGNGVIARYGPFSTYGNYALIKHANGYETAYGHMSRYVPGLHAGSHVHQGQVIGYVGMTGGATGPHLHYEVHIKGKPVNAMKLKLPTGRKLTGEQLAAFDAERDRIDALRAAEHTGVTLVADQSPAADAAQTYQQVPVVAASTPESRE